MSALETLRAKAAKAAEALRDAETRAETEAAAARQRNTERVAAFWADAGDRCQAARAAIVDARATVVDLVAAGDLADALNAYSEYVRRVVEAARLTGAAQSATAAYVWTETRQVDPDDRARKAGDGFHRPAMETVERRALVTDWHRDQDMPPSQYRTEHPAGVAGNIGKPAPFEALMAEGLTRLEDTHGAAFTADLLAPLRAGLEPEGQ